MNVQPFVFISLGGVMLPALLLGQVTVTAEEGPAFYRSLGASVESFDPTKSPSQSDVLAEAAKSHSATLTGKSVVLPTFTAEADEVPAFVYQAPFNPKIRIEVYDRGYGPGFTATDRDNFISLLASLPASHVEGLKKIVLDDANAPTYIGQEDMLVIRRPKNAGNSFSGPEWAWIKTVDLANALGMRYYNTRLTEAERREFRSLVGPVYGDSGDAVGSFIFAAQYGDFVTHGTKSLSQTFRSTTPNSPYFWGMNLMAASVFISPNTPVITDLRIDLRTGRVIHSYSPATRAPNAKGEDVFTLGNFNLVVPDIDNTASAWFDSAAAFPGEAPTPITQRLEVPQTLLNRLPFRN